MPTFQSSSIKIARIISSLLFCVSVCIPATGNAARRPVSSAVASSVSSLDGGDSESDGGDSANESIQDAAVAPPLEAARRQLAAHLEKLAQVWGMSYDPYSKKIQKLDDYRLQLENSKAKEADVGKAYSEFCEAMDSGLKGESRDPSFVQAARNYAQSLTKKKDNPAQQKTYDQGVASAYAALAEAYARKLRSHPDLSQRAADFAKASREYEAAVKAGDSASVKKAHQELVASHQGLVKQLGKSPPSTGPKRRQRPPGGSGGGSTESSHESGIDSRQGNGSRGSESETLSSRSSRSDAFEGERDRGSSGRRQPRAQVKGEVESRGQERVKLGGDDGESGYDGDRGFGAAAAALRKQLAEQQGQLGALRRELQKAQSSRKNTDVKTLKAITARIEKLDRLLRQRDAERARLEAAHQAKLDVAVAAARAESAQALAAKDAAHAKAIQIAVVNEGVHLKAEQAALEAKLEGEWRQAMIGNAEDHAKHVAHMRDLVQQLRVEVSRAPAEARGPISELEAQLERQLEESQRSSGEIQRLIAAGKKPGDREMLELKKESQVNFGEITQKLVHLRQEIAKLPEVHRQKAEVVAAEERARMAAAQAAVVAQKQDLLRGLEQGKAAQVERVGALISEIDRHKPESLSQDVASKLAHLHDMQKTLGRFAPPGVDAALAEIQSKIAELQRLQVAFDNAHSEFLPLLRLEQEKAQYRQRFQEVDQAFQAATRLYVNSRPEKLPEGAHSPHLLSDAKIILAQAKEHLAELQRMEGEMKAKNPQLIRSAARQAEVEGEIAWLEKELPGREERLQALESSYGKFHAAFQQTPQHVQKHAEVAIAELSEINIRELQGVAQCQLQRNPFEEIRKLQGEIRPAFQALRDRAFAAQHAIIKGNTSLAAVAEMVQAVRQECQTNFQGVLSVLSSTGPGAPQAESIRNSLESARAACHANPGQGPHDFKLLNQDFAFYCAGEAEYLVPKTVNGCDLTVGTQGTFKSHYWALDLKRTGQPVRLLQMIKPEGTKGGVKQNKPPILQAAEETILQAVESIPGWPGGRREDKIALADGRIYQTIPYGGVDLKDEDEDTRRKVRNLVFENMEQKDRTACVNSLLSQLALLHQNGIIHRDIKPANVLFNPHTKQCQLIDFGGSMRLNAEAGQVVTAGYNYTPQYTAGPVDGGDVARLVGEEEAAMKHGGLATGARHLDALEHEVAKSPNGKYMMRHMDYFQMGYLMLNVLSAGKVADLEKDILEIKSESNSDKKFDKTVTLRNKLDGKKFLNFNPIQKDLIAILLQTNYPGPGGSDIALRSIKKARVAVCLYNHIINRVPVKKRNRIVGGESVGLDKLGKLWVHVSYSDPMGSEDAQARLDAYLHDNDCP